MTTTATTALPYLLNHDSPKEKQPSKGVVMLKEHQLAMLHKLMAIEQYNVQKLNDLFDEKVKELKAKEDVIPRAVMIKQLKEYRQTLNGIGIMCDKAGAGKTYVLLSLILKDIEDQADVMTTNKSMNIIVVPQNIYTQWMESIEVFSAGSIRYNKFIEYSDISSLYFSADLSGYNILLTTPIYYSLITDALAVKNIMVKRVIIDEIDNVALFIQKGICAEMVWLVSASFLENKKEYTEQLKIPIKDEAEFQNIICKCDDKFVDQSFALWEPEFVKKRCNNVYIEVMKDTLDPKEIQMLNAYDLSGIRLEEVNTNPKTFPDLYECYIKNLTMKINKEKTYHDSLFESLKKVEDSTSDKNIMNLLEVSKTVIEEYEALYRVLEENKQKLYPSSDVPFKHEKIDILKSIIDTSIAPDKTKKTIVFSDYTFVFTSIIEILKEHDMKYTEIDNSNIKSIDNSINAYKYGDVDVLLINSAYYGCGMNLENTTDIVFFHRANETMFKQIVGRAQRPGRTSRLRVWEILHENECC